MKKYSLIIFLILLISCEDPVPYDYTPENILQAFLIVGDPIEDILLFKSQPINKTFEIENAVIDNAEITIKYSAFDLAQLDFTFQEEFRLEYRKDKGLKYVDNSGHIVQKLSRYEILIKLPDNSTIEAMTITPDSLIWKDAIAANNVQYPIDSINFSTSDELLIWEPVSALTSAQTNGYYHLQVKNLDTTEYGIYLDPPDPEKMNRRITRDHRPDWRYNETSSSNYIPSTNTSVVWNIFKWYGRHEITIYSMDFNWSRALLQQLASSAYDPLLSSLEGNGIGTFASACAIRDTFFLVKNQE